MSSGMEKEGLEGDKVCDKVVERKREGEEGEE